MLELRRWTLKFTLNSGWVVLKSPRAGARDRELVHVQEVVEPGHDEQTEARKNIERMREVTDEVARLNAQIHGPWQPDPRTVAAVVEFLRAKAGEPGQFLGVLLDAANFIEERFKPSAPGGDDAGG